MSAGLLRHLPQDQGYRRSLSLVYGLGLRHAVDAGPIAPTVIVAERAAEMLLADA